MAYDIDQTLVILPGNAGFGAANNAAVQFAQSDRVLIVNPDVFPCDQDWALKHSRYRGAAAARANRHFRRNTLLRRWITDARWHVFRGAIAVSRWNNLPSSR